MYFQHRSTLPRAFSGTLSIGFHDSRYHRKPTLSYMCIFMQLMRVALAREDIEVVAYNDPFIDPEVCCSQ